MYFNQIGMTITSLSSSFFYSKGLMSLRYKFITKVPTYSIIEINLNNIKTNINPSHEKTTTIYYVIHELVGGISIQM